MEGFNEEICMEQTYSLLTGRETYEELLSNGKNVYVLFDPEKSIKDIDASVYDALLDYFINTEEYEKCNDVLAAKQLAKLI
tara:strand:- start:2566 stop:2808 length:243 start_codon:yes stop_codon:yes gene_type:complete